MKNLIIKDEFAPEDIAMLQALYSRSNKSVLDHIEDNKHSASGKFMENYYVKYGHASIADCGTTTVFFEGVSILAAKEIQDDRLYNGQETSSRYIAFNVEDCYVPYDIFEIREAQKKLFDFYYKVHSRLVQDYIADGISPKTANARAFDVARGWLPCGAQTQLSWTTSLRKLREGIFRLRNSSFAEVRDIAEILKKEAERKYPHTMVDIDDGFVRYNDKHVYADITGMTNEYIEFIGISEAFDVFKQKFGDNWSDIEFDDKYGIVGDFYINLPIDYGSWRDLQRHRSILTMNVHPSNYNPVFHEWYFDQLSDDMRQEGQDLVEWIYDKMEKYDENNAVYALPLGTKVNYLAKAPFPAFVYMVNLRSQETVHPTARHLVRKLQEWVRSEFGVDIGNFSAIKCVDDRRGEQTIEKV